MFELTKSHQAEDDLIDIWESTYRTWGEAQAERYLDDIEAAMVNLARNPNIGKAREAIRPGYRSWQVKRHVIFYRTIDETLFIVRVLHDRMDPEVQMERSDEP